MYVMKMKPSDYQDIAIHIERFLDMYPAITFEYYKSQNRSHKRYRWDLLYYSDFDICSLYYYLNDNHIDTALRNIVKD